MKTCNTLFQRKIHVWSLVSLCVFEIEMFYAACLSSLYLPVTLETV